MTADAYGGIPHEPALISLSCPRPSFCAASDAFGHALTYDGSRWSAPVWVGPRDRYRVGPLSCASSSFCVALSSADGVHANSILTFDGSSWTGLHKVAGAGALYAITCRSSSFCVAVGTAHPHWNGDVGGEVVVYDGTSWSAPEEVDPKGGGLQLVSCASPSFCVAVDATGMSLAYDGSSWGAPRRIGPASGARFKPTDVSCITRHFCVAVGASGLGAPLEEQSATFNGASWSLPAPTGLSTRWSAGSVSCPTRLFCLAVGDGSFVRTIASR
jgi:hypothetical protein